MGVVYSAYDENLDRKVALKFLRTQATVVEQNARDRMLREAQAMARLSHPNVVQVFDVGTHEDEVFLAMEFVRGTTLDHWLRSEPRSGEAILGVFSQAARGLAAAHSAGLVHRDFKPSNVLVTVDTRAVVTDFGSARGIGSQGEQRELVSEPTSHVASSSGALLARCLTQTGTILGTPAYMSPEQHQGRQAQPSSDQFSFCVALFEALCGKRPFGGQTRAELYANIVAGNIVVSNVSGVAARALPVLRRGLSYEPLHRFRDMHALLAALARASGRRRRRVLLIATGLAISTSIGGAWALLTPTNPLAPCETLAAAIDSAWNPKRQSELERQFTAADPVSTTETELTSQAIETYVERWREASRRACRETRELEIYSPRVLDQRVTCLQKRRAELDALLVEFSRADESIVRTATEAVNRLRQPDTCDDVDALSRGITPPDPRSADAIAGVRGIIATAEAAELAGRDSEAVARANEAVRASRAVDYAPLTAEALTVAGWAEYRVSQDESAESKLRRAIDLAVAHRHDEAAADAWNFLLMTRRSATSPANARATEDIYRQTVSAIQRLSKGKSERMAEALSSMAFVHKSLSELNEAAELAERALAIRETAPNPQSRQIVRSQMLLGDIYTELGRWQDALIRYDEALRGAASSMGPRHPGYALLLVNAGVTQTDAGRFELAASGFQRASEIYERSASEDMPSEGVGWVRTAKAYLALGQHEPALAKSHALAAREIYERVYERDNVILADPLLLYARAEYALGNYENALTHLHEALAIQHRPAQDQDLQTDSDPVIREVATLLVWVARAHAGLGKYQEAADYFDRGVSAFERILPNADVHPRFIDALLSRGANRLMLGEAEEAQADFARAAKGSQSTPPHLQFFRRANLGTSIATSLLTMNHDSLPRVWENLREHVIGEFPQ